MLHTGIGTQNRELSVTEHPMAMFLTPHLHNNSLSMWRTLAQSGTVIIVVTAAHVDKDFGGVEEVIHIPTFRGTSQFPRYLRKRLRLYNPLRLRQHVAEHAPDVLVVKQGMAPWLARLAVPRTTRVVAWRNRELSGTRHLADRMFRFLRVSPKRSFHTAGAGAIGRPGATGSILIPYPAPLVAIDSSTTDKRQSKLDFESRHLRIICVSVFKDRKRPDWLAKAAARADTSRTFELHYVGRAEDESLRASIEQAQRESERITEVSYLGTLPHDQVLRLYQDYDIFVLPAQREPFGYSVVEAMAAGLPVVCATDCGARSAIIPEESGLLFDTDDLDSLSKAISKLANDDSFRESMGKKARQRAADELSPQAWVGTFTDCFLDN